MKIHRTIKYAALSAAMLLMAHSAFAIDDLTVIEGFGAFDAATFAKYPGFGSPLWAEGANSPTPPVPDDLQPTKRVGFDSGICHVTYTAAQMKAVGVPIDQYGADGLYE